MSSLPSDHIGFFDHFPNFHCFHPGPSCPHLFPRSLKQPLLDLPASLLPLQSPLSLEAHLVLLEYVRGTVLKTCPGLRRPFRLSPLAAISSLLSSPSCCVPAPSASLPFLGNMRDALTPEPVCFLSLPRECSFPGAPLVVHSPPPVGLCSTVRALLDVLLKLCPSPPAHPPHSLCFMLLALITV